MTLQEAAIQLNKSPHTLRRHIKSSKLQANLINNKYDISEEALQLYIDESGTGEQIESENAMINNWVNQINNLNDQIVNLKEQLEVQTEHLRQQLEQAMKTIQQLQQDGAEAQQRSDTIILQLTRQLDSITEQNQLLLEDKRPNRRWYHRLLMWNNA